MIRKSSSVSDEMRAQADTQERLGKALRNFILGTFLSGVPIFTLLGISIYTTQTAWGDVGRVSLGVAIATSLMGGLVSVALKERFIAALSSVLESGNLPF